MQLHVPLKYGCAAAVITDETDRPPYVPPPIPRAEHDVACRCPVCRLALASAPHPGRRS